MKGGRDAVADQLAVGVEQGETCIEMHAGPRHELALERIAVQVDNSRQDQQPAGVPSFPAYWATQSNNPSVLDREGDIGLYAALCEDTAADNAESRRHGGTHFDDDHPFVPCRYDTDMTLRRLAARRCYAARIVPRK
jgi:hypothetical protein